MNSTTSDNTVIVIGAGLGGLAAACTLAARGHAVTILEANDWLGGKAAVWEQDGYRFDMGPTILTVPRVLKRIFAEAGRRMEDYLDLVALDPQWRCFFDDGSTLDLCADVAKMKQTLAAFSTDPRDVERYEKFINHSHRLHDISERFYFWKSIGGIRDMMDPKASFNLGTLSDVMAMGMGRSVAGTIRSYIGDGRVSQMLDHFTQYVGSSPEASPAVLCGIAHMQTNDGVWYPMGGTGAVPAALAKLARELGVNVITSAEAARIEHDGNGVAGVTLKDGRRLPASAVVSNMDAVRTYRELIGGRDAQKFEKSRGSFEPACSGVVLYLGLKQRYDHLLHHDFVFSRDPHEEFDYIYRRGEPAPDPTCYLAAPAGTEPGVAPAGGEALYVLVHTPYLRPGQDWRKMLPDYRRVILDKLKRTAGLTDIEDRIVVERTLTPQDIHDRYRVLNGAIYGLASHGKFLGAFKPANRRKDIAGLYVAGGAAHPGPGMPMVLMSGWIAGDSLDQDRRGSTASPDTREAALAPV
ncbi:MAG TPA: phytoene desaturase family protein [Tepidisphaeraceae bacterium]|jgi:phytoene desaturase|nr:phytoene desaturase family protein [Tepidisphaeraceae bacterium]